VHFSPQIQAKPDTVRPVGRHGVDIRGDRDDRRFKKGLQQRHVRQGASARFREEERRGRAAACLAAFRFAVSCLGARFGARFAAPLAPACVAPNRLVPRRVRWRSDEAAGRRRQAVGAGQQVRRPIDARVGARIDALVDTNIDTRVDTNI
jgi:hypothetical protein